MNRYRLADICRLTVKDRSAWKNPAIAYLALLIEEAQG